MFRSVAARAGNPAGPGHHAPRVLERFVVAFRADHELSRSVLYRAASRTHQLFIGFHRFEILVELKLIVRIWRCIMRRHLGTQSVSLRRLALQGERVPRDSLRAHHPPVIRARERCGCQPC